MVDYEMLNRMYHPLCMKCAELKTELTHRIFDVECGWYNGHYKRNKDGQYQMDHYPIPVISVKGYCDIEIDFERITVTTKLKRDKAIPYTFQKFAGIPFEAYGVENYLEDFYLMGMTIDEMHENIKQSDEDEIGFNFMFSPEISGKAVYEFVKLLRREEFYY